jgi:DNA-binding transcriptional LysR family regulator
MELRRLRLFAAVVEAGSMSAAASALSYSTSSVSEQIAALERDVGMQLLERAPRGVRLTAAGELLADRAEQILAQVAALQAELDDLAGLRTGQLRAGAFSTAGAMLLPLAASAFAARHPGVRLSIAEADPDEALALLVAGELDLALIYEFEGHPLSLPGGLEQHDLLEDTLHLIAPRGHITSRREVIALADLADERWIQGVRHGSTADVLPAACRAAGFEPQIVTATDDPMAVQGFVAAGLGLAVVSQLLLPVTRADVDVRQLRPALRRTVRVARRGGISPPPVEAAMLAVLVDVGHSVSPLGSGAVLSPRRGEY